MSFALAIINSHNKFEIHRIIYYFWMGRESIYEYKQITIPMIEVSFYYLLLPEGLYQVWYNNILVLHTILNLLLTIFDNGMLIFVSLIITIHQPILFSNCFISKRWYWSLKGGFLSILYIVLYIMKWVVMPLEHIFRLPWLIHKCKIFVIFIH